MNKEEQVIITTEIIETAYRLLTQKLAHGGLTAKNEASFQLELGYILKTLGQLYEFKQADKFHLELEGYLSLKEQSIKSKSERARVDILLTYRDDMNSTSAAIELKFYKKENQREPNNRYDVFKDIANLELYKSHGIDLCYLILATDHPHYVHKERYSADTSDFDFRHNASYKAGSVLRYKTEKPHGPDLSLSQDYSFQWDHVNGLYFLKLRV